MNKVPLATATAVHLTPEEAMLFIEFQKRYAFIKLMESLGVFELRSSKVIINFDKLGQIGSVEINKHYSLDNVGNDIIIKNT